MPVNNLITVFIFDIEIGKIGYDPNRLISTFQFNPEFLASGKLTKVFPSLIKRTEKPQVFRENPKDHFRGLPPAIADSLPDVFGNLIFKTWMEANHKDFQQISILEQLAYVGNRGMGALEYRPSKNIPAKANIDLNEIIKVLEKVINNKNETSGEQLDTKSLLNIFKIGSSAGGARPKILISEHKETQKIIPGDIETSNEYNHYLVKLSMDESMGYNREAVEYSYYQIATSAGIEMSFSKLIEDKHFATVRFDRQNGKKKHVLTASGISGIDFNDAENSSYENLFELALFLKLPPKQLDQLFQRMVFNVVFSNYDDHLKNHSFIYDEAEDKWNLSPAYDLTYAINPMLQATKKLRALSIGGKRENITKDDLLKIAETFTIKNPKGIIENVVLATKEWPQMALKLGVPEKVVKNIYKDFKRF